MQRSVIHASCKEKITKTHDVGTEMKPDPGQWEWQIGNQQLSRNHYYFLSKVEKCNYEKSDAILDPDILSSQLGQFLKIQRQHIPPKCHYLL